LVESVAYADYIDLAPKSSAEETIELAEKYGVERNYFLYPDVWFGAVIYCKDKGLRLPTMLEIIAITEAIYGPLKYCRIECTFPPQYTTGCCDYSSSLTVKNTELKNWLNTANAWGGAFWSAAQRKKGYGHSFVRYIPHGSQAVNQNNHYGFGAICVK